MRKIVCAFPLIMNMQIFSEKLSVDLSLVKKNNCKDTVSKSTASSGGTLSKLNQDKIVQNE